MRLSHHSAFIEFDGMVVGINLGYGRCGEHEQGIAAIESLFGVGSAAPRGIERRKVTAPNLAKAILVDDGDTLTLAMGRDIEAPDRSGEEDSVVVVPAAELHIRDGQFMRRSDFYDVRTEEGRIITRKLRDRNPKGKAGKQALASWSAYHDRRDGGLRCAWDQRSFAVTALNDRAKEVIRDLAAAFAQGTLLISMGSESNPFGANSLCISMLERIPQHIRDAVLAEDLDYEALEKAKRDSGVVEMLAGAGFRNCSANPKWVSEDKDAVRFFVSFYEPSLGAVLGKHVSGWVTADDVRDYVRDRSGPLAGDATNDVREQAGMSPR